jgi:hypothetical protein
MVLKNVSARIVLRPQRAIRENERLVCENAHAQPLSLLTT